MAEEEEEESTLAGESPAVALAELAALLSNYERADVVAGASSLVEGLTGTVDGIDELIAGAELIVPALVTTVIVATSPKVASDATKRDLGKAASHCLGALVNLSQRVELAPLMVQRGAMAAAARLLSRQTARHEWQERLVMLLANLTQDAEASRRLIALEGGVLEELLMRFEQSHRGGGGGGGGETEEEEEEDDPLAHLSSVFMNLVKTREGKEAMGEEEKLNAPKRLSTLLKKGGGRTRRRGIAGTLKNMCMEGGGGGEGGGGAIPKTMLDAAVLRDVFRSDVGVPRDEDEGVRVMLADLLLLIAREESGLDALKEVRAVQKCQACYEEETDGEVCKTFEEIAELFMNKNMVEADGVVKRGIENAANGMGGLSIQEVVE